MHLCDEQNCVIIYTHMSVSYVKSECPS